MHCFSILIKFHLIETADFDILYKNKNQYIFIWMSKFRWVGLKRAIIKENTESVKAKQKAGKGKSKKRRKFKVYLCIAKGIFSGSITEFSILKIPCHGN